MVLKRTVKGPYTPPFCLMRVAIAVPILTGAMLLAGHGAMAQDSPPGDVSGVWWITEYSPNLAVQGGGEIPYNEEGSALYARNIAGLENGSLEDEARTICTPDGVPRILGNPYPFKIVHTPDQTTILYELNDVYRIILMDTPQLSEEELFILPYYSGHSIGYWEGDTLVVETAGYKDKTFLDATGAPHSYEMTTVERYRTINGGTQLENIVTMTDPLFLTEPVTARYVYDAHPEVRLQTYVCGEPHRDISLVPGVMEARRARNP
jgi:hypothetical protein